MNRHLGAALRAGALSAAVAAATAASAHGQQIYTTDDLYGVGPEGTIGRGTNNMPGGPSAPSVLYRWGPNPSPALGYSYYAPWPGTTVANSPGFAPVRRASAPVAAARPYLTNRTYQPGDGYRYPLYYNPATRSYYYYPVRR